MSAQAGRWSADQVERRFGSQRRPAELAELAGTLGGMLDRISAVLRHERQLSAELSHELRTPRAGFRPSWTWSAPSHAMPRSCPAPTRRSRPRSIG